MTNCIHCGASWSGLNTAHCTACHTTFTGITAFDMHRKNYQCLRPEHVGLHPANRKYPCWGTANPDERWEADE